MKNADALIEASYLPTDITSADLDHPVWSQAHPVSIVHYWSGERAPAGRHAEARIIWSAGALFVRFVCPRTEPLVVSQNPQANSKTPGLWDRDVCEIFIAPNPDEPSRYFEFEVAPTGEWVDLAIKKTAKGRETDFAFHSGMTAAAYIGDDKIFLAMRIPWSKRIPATPAWRKVAR